MSETPHQPNCRYPEVEIDQLLTDEQIDWSDSDSAGEVLWAMTEHLGSVTDVIDSNADLRIHKVYDTFGNVVDETHYNTSGTVVTAGQAGFVTVAFAFTGRYFDADTGLQNNLNRWYDATIGRWLSEDPIGLGPDENLYRYVGNAPTMYVDPSGLEIYGDGFPDGPPYLPHPIGVVPTPDPRPTPPPLPPPGTVPGPGWTPGRVGLGSPIQDRVVVPG